MKQEFTPQAYKIISRAQIEARQRMHDFVATEHLLLALLTEDPNALAPLNVTANAVRNEIEKLVAPGVAASTAAEFPLTPRAQRAIDHAIFEAKMVEQMRVGPEHLLVGLIQEPDGVAGRALRSLGLDVVQVRRKCMTLRLAQMRIVERAVRPVRASMAKKRKMREELMAHFATIYEEEESRLNDRHAALTEAARRFGDPAELARDLGQTSTREEWVNYQAERWLGWRPPESADRMMLRVVLVTFCSVVCLIGLPLWIAALITIDTASKRPATRMFAAMCLMIPIAHFLIGICYYRMRDALWGAFGAKKSLRNAIVLGILLTLSVFVSTIGMVTIMNANLSVARDFAPNLIGLSVLAGLGYFIEARTRGPVEIRDTVWSCLDLEEG